MTSAPSRSLVEDRSDRPRWREAPSLSERERRALDWAFVTLLVAGIALRVAFVNSSAFRMDSDHAIVYLMAKHVADGELPSFFWGQSYGGTALSLIAGTIMLVTGPAIAVLSITSALIWAGAAVILRALVTRSLGARAGFVAATLFWFPGGVILGTSLIDPGFYGPSLVLGLGTILLVARTEASRSWGQWMAIGLLSGLALWTSPLAVAMAAPAVALALWRDRRPRLWLVFALAAALGAAPWIVETVRSRLSSVKPLGGASLHPESLASIFTSMFPAAFPGGSNELIAFIIALATIALLGMLVQRSVATRNFEGIAVAAGTVLVILLLVAVTGVRLAPDSVRYSAFLIPGLAMSVAWLLRRNLALAIVGAASAVAITVAAVVSTPAGFALQEPDPFPDQLEQVDEFLDEAGIEAAYGSYWAAYALSAESDEEPTVASIAPRRYPGYEEAAERDAPMAIVVFSGAQNDEVLAGSAEHVPAERREFGPYAVYVYDEWFDPYSLPLGLN